MIKSCFIKIRLCLKSLSYDTNRSYLYQNLLNTIYILRRQDCSVVKKWKAYGFILNKTIILPIVAIETNDSKRLHNDETWNTFAPQKSNSRIK